MGDLLQYQSSNNTIVELLDQGIQFSHYLLSNFNIRQGQYFPVIVQSEKPGVYMVPWGIENPILAEGPVLTYLYAPSIEKQESLNKLLRNQRILIPVNQFIHYRSSNQPNVLIQDPKEKVLWLAGVWAESRQGVKGFALITRNSKAEQKKYMRRMPIFIKGTDNIHKWLDKNFTGKNETDSILGKNYEVDILLNSPEMAEV